MATIVERSAAAVESASMLVGGEWVASLAGHDDNHLDQLRRTLELP